MRDVKVKRYDLLVKIRANREKHVVEYEEAVKGYLGAVFAALSDTTQELQRRFDRLEAGEVLVLQSITFNLQVPGNHAKDYDQVIAMLEMSVDEELTIRSDEFACYVMDDWDWKEDFLNVSNVYKKNK